MKTTQILPPHYYASGKFDLKNFKLLVLMNLAGLVLFVFSVWFFGWLTTQLRSEITGFFSFEFSSLSSLATSFGKLIITIIFVLSLHEAVHALFFWIFSQQKPVVGFKGFFAYASMPGWYFPRNQYLIIGIAPLILITLVGVVCLAILPSTLLNLVLVALVLNTSGAIGDLFVVIWLLTKPVETLALDQIDTIEFFVPGKPQSNQENEAKSGNNNQH
ncbi:MAG: DUF3267 domain-containing protein [Anaerolineaceae bacterium]|nr:DUF3267 domain-containing protein [Anaerolineaceae bacterium]